MINGQTMFSREPANSTADRHAADADRADLAGGNGESMLHGGPIELTGGESGLSTHGFRERIDLGGLPAGEIDHHAASWYRPGGGAMSPTLDCDRKIVGIGESNRRGHIVRSHRYDDDCRSAAIPTVMHRASLVIPLVAIDEGHSLKLRTQLIDARNDFLLQYDRHIFFSSTICALTRRVH